MLLVVLGLMYLVLGMILDGISIVVMTLPIVLAAGFDPLWFGIYLVIMVELSQITPPVGFSLFVTQGISYEPVSYIIKSTLPFLIIMILMVVLLAVFPDLVLFLPNQVIK